MAKDRTSIPNRPLGLPDGAFEQRSPMKGLITKAEVRAVTLYSMGLCRDSLVWDIGAGTGSLSVEAALIAHHGQVYAVERDEANIGLLRTNVERWGSDNVHVVLGEAPEALNGLPDPDSVFIGGSGGQLPPILEATSSRLRSPGRVVVNLAAMERAQETYHRLQDLGFEAQLVMVNVARGKAMPGGATRLEALNPVFIVTGRREGDRHE